MFRGVCSTFYTFFVSNSAKICGKNMKDHEICHEIRSSFLNIKTLCWIAVPPSPKLQISMKLVFFFCCCCFWMILCFFLTKLFNIIFLWRCTHYKPDEWGENCAENYGLEFPVNCNIYMQNISTLKSLRIHTESRNKQKEQILPFDIHLIELICYSTIINLHHIKQNTTDSNTKMSLKNSPSKYGYLFIQ